MDRKIKVGFYIENGNSSDIDLRFPFLGNPGVGGTQFSEIFTANYLSELYAEELQIVLFVKRPAQFPPQLETFLVHDCIEAAIRSNQEGCDVFIFWSKLINQKLWDQLCKLKVRAIARSDSFLTFEELNWLASCPQIRAHVCVGQEQLDLYRDHKIFNKSIRIFNSIATETYVPPSGIAKHGNTVVYMGSLIYSKGFHVLARVWPQILQRRSDAKLIVIGSGKLYQTDQELGRWGVAEEEYEAAFVRPFLSNQDGKPIESVHFAGLLGAKKVDILRSADVGVVNPTGETETFCISAVEFQACGTPVVSAARGGLLDTIAHQKTGLLGRSDRELIENILNLLNQPAIAREFGRNGIDYVTQNFDYQVVSKQWFELITGVVKNTSLQPQSMKNNYLYNAKFLREGMRILKKQVPLLHHLPALIEVKPLLKKLLKFIHLK